MSAVNNNIYMQTSHDLVQCDVADIRPCGVMLVLLACRKSILFDLITYEGRFSWSHIWYELWHTFDTFGVLSNAIQLLQQWVEIWITWSTAPLQKTNRHSCTHVQGRRDLRYIKTGRGNISLALDMLVKLVTTCLLSLTWCLPLAW